MSNNCDNCGEITEINHNEHWGLAICFNCEIHARKCEAVYDAKRAIMHVLTEYSPTKATRMQLKLALSDLVGNFKGCPEVDLESDV